MFLNTGQKMISKSVSASASENYALLPTLCHVMKSGDKQLGLDIITRWQDTYTVECVSEINTSCKVILSVVKGICVCLLMEREHSEMVQMVITQKIPEEPEQISCVAEARKHVKFKGNGLDTFQIIPKCKGGGNKLSGYAAFAQKVAFQNVQMEKKGTLRLE